MTMETGEPTDPNAAYRPPDPYGPPQAYYTPQPVNPWQPGYAPPGYAPPGYAPPGYGPPGYPPPGYGYAHQPQPYTGPVRPSEVLGASVLAYVLGGLLILAGLLLIFGASLSSSMGDAFDADTGSITAELAFDGVVNLVAAGLLIAGAVSLTGGRLGGRTLLACGAGITVAASIYWLARSSGERGAGVYAFLFDALAVIAVCLMFSGAVTRWLRARSTFG
jgi:hypothetical protein